MRYLAEKQESIEIHEYLDPNGAGYDDSGNVKGLAQMGGSARKIKTYTNRCKMSLASSPKTYQS